MVHSSIFNISELLDQILHFLAEDKALYRTLFVCRLWYRCSAPILWKSIELKGDGVEEESQLERFKKLVRSGQKPLYSSKLTHLKITHCHSLSIKQSKALCACSQI
jgi:hypothetical protein